MYDKFLVRNMEISQEDCEITKNFSFTKTFTKRGCIVVSISGKALFRKR